jgi:MFS superfamily sulfate permease-like transporter
VKQKLEHRFPSIAYVPDRFLVVVLSAVLTYQLEWDKQGLEILGEVKSSGGSAFPFHWPFVPEHMTHVREAMSTSFLIALLGFFESSVAAKALGGGENKPPEEAIQGMNLSANRELVALGVANLVGGCFMALPAFGGYGRSKVNKSTGGKTPMSSILLSLITVISVLYLVPYFYYLPKGVLSAMVSVVAYSLIEECPHDIHFFVKVRGWAELALMFLIFAATILYSLPLGIALGMGLSLLSVIKHATKPRIQLLGRVPGTTNQFDNAEYLARLPVATHANNQHDEHESSETASNALIVKIPEPLTFANTGDLRSRLRRLEMYGSISTHPATPRLRAEWQNRTIVFDVHGVTSIDASGAQVLSEIIQDYVHGGSRVFFCRVPGGPDGRVMRMFERAGIVETCGGGTAFTQGVDAALRLAAEAGDADEVDV